MHSKCVWEQDMKLKPEINSNFQKDNRGVIQTIARHLRPSDTHYQHDHCPVKKKKKASDLMHFNA